MDIKRPGPAFSAILGQCGWEAAGFNAYLSLQEVEAKAINALLPNIENRNDSDSAIEDGGNDPSSPSYKRHRSRYNAPLVNSHYIVF